MPFPTLGDTPPIVTDLDGVLVDFWRPAYALFDKAYDEDNAPSNYDFWLDWGISNNAFWKVIADHSPDFWANLPLYPWAEQLLKLFGTRITVATTPALHWTSVAGKVQFIQRMFGDEFREYHITPTKWELGCPGRILIDDGEENCDRFTAKGGKAILFPQNWNRNRHLQSRSIDYVAELLDAYGHRA